MPGDRTAPQSTQSVPSVQFDFFEDIPPSSQILLLDEAHVSEHPSKNSGGGYGGGGGGAGKVTGCGGVGRVRYESAP